jgi:hypothetical protein
LPEPAISPARFHASSSTSSPVLSSWQYAFNAEPKRRRIALLGQISGREEKRRARVKEFLGHEVCPQSIFLSNPASRDAEETTKTLSASPRVRRGAPTTPFQIFQLRYQSPQKSAQLHSLPRRPRLAEIEREDLRSNPSRQPLLQAPRAPL